MNSIYSTRIVSAGVLLLLSLLGRGTLAQSAGDAADEPPPAVDKWIATLESDTYTARVRATERLIMAGGRSVEPLLQAIDSGGLETISRGIYILRQIALSAEDPSTQELAYQGLRVISQRRFSGASRRALTALQAVHEFRFHRAQLQLSQLGAVLSVSPVQVALGVRDAFPSIMFGEAWRGQPVDLAQAGWITSFPQEDFDKKWMLIVEGRQITDDWIDRIRAIENVAVVKFKSTQTTADTIQKLAVMPDLEILELLYTPITDAEIDHLAALPKLARLRLIGTEVTAAGVNELRRRMAQVDIDYRNGGFLGISCSDNPCRITLVQEGSAAAQAGLRVDDVITKYHQTPVKTMDELTRAIAEHPVGEQVEVKVLRGDEETVLGVTLGAWD